MSNIVRLVFTSAASIILPKVLVGSLTRDEYSAWVLILQLTTYIGLFDLGLQTVVTKFIAEHHARGDRESNRQVISGAFTLLAAFAGVGLLAILVLAWQADRLLPSMSPGILVQLRIGLIAVGVSAAISLPFGAFLAAFTGLQEYAFPTALVVVSRLVSAAVLVVLALLGVDLVGLAFALAGVNLLTAISQYVGWRRLASHHFAFTLFWLGRATANRLMRSGGVIALWSLGGLFVSGLDTVIVGHFDFVNTGYYALAATASNLTMTLLGGLFAPVMPAISALQSVGTAADVGRSVIRVSRYCTLVVLLLDTTLVVFAHPILTLWVGRDYADHSTLLLQLLVIGNGLRQLGYPFSMAVIATNRQIYGTIASLSEAAVNFGVSIWLVTVIGAPGAAIGTIVGAVVSIGLHLLVSMPATRASIGMHRRTFVGGALLRPAVCFVPVVVAAALVQQVAPWIGDLVIAAAGVVTLLLVWTVALSGEDHRFVAGAVRRFVPRRLRQRTV
jgi:O-antigen/teichoic acid export membrane protein